MMNISDYRQIPDGPLERGDKPPSLFYVGYALWDGEDDNVFLTSGVRRANVLAFHAWQAADIVRENIKGAMGMNAEIHYVNCECELTFALAATVSAAVSFVQIDKKLQEIDAFEEGSF